MKTSYHAKYWAEMLTLARPQDDAAGLSRSLANARVDLQPHQIDAALFALRSPFSKGVLLADEVGLGKTIEAGLVLSQKWAERRRRILLIVPATLRKQWQGELTEKFFLPTQLLETRTANLLRKEGRANPFDLGDRVVIASYQFVYANQKAVHDVAWDLVVVDEAHRLRNVYKNTGAKLIQGIVDAIRPAKKLLLTATPLQNSLLELYGLVSILDDEVFGSADAFTERYVAHADEDTSAHLRERLASVCKRTLRKQVAHFIPFTNRRTFTADFLPSAAEVELYDLVTEYLQRDKLAALPTTQRKLITMVLRKLLASSSAAIGATLGKLAKRLRDALPEEAAEEAVGEDFEGLDEVEDEWGDDDGGKPPAPPTRAEVAGEIADLERFVALAASIGRDAKADALLGALDKAFAGAIPLGARRKAVVFTESTRTQQRLFELLTQNGYDGEVVLLNGTNTDPGSKATYEAWKKRNAPCWKDVTSGSRTADTKAAIVEELRDRGTILLATESAAEGVNLQFCSIVVNYDLPWNPQRIEQRIGRCHRYGQKCDVLVVNFLNRTNAADQRVFDLLSQKFSLFEGVFGASDDVLGAVESGVDLERRIAEILQDCRTTEDIQAGFDALQRELDDVIRARMADTKQAILDHFDQEVTDRLKVHRDKARESLDEVQRVLLELARHELQGKARFVDGEPCFFLPGDGGDEVGHQLQWERAELEGHVFFRPGEGLGHDLIEQARGRLLQRHEVVFQYAPHASALADMRGQSGWLEVTRLATDVLDRREESLIVAACTDDGTPVPPDVAVRLFDLDADVRGPAPTAPAAIDAIRGALEAERVHDLDTRNESHFVEEADKLEARQDDLRLGIDREIKALEKAMGEVRREKARGKSLAEKLDAERRLRTLQDQHTEKKRRYFEEQDTIRAQHDALIRQTEEQLRDRKVERKNVLTLRFTLT